MDSNGREFNRNRLIALMAAIVLEEVCFYNFPQNSLLTMSLNFDLVTAFCSNSTLEQQLSQTVLLQMGLLHSLRKNSVIRFYFI